MVILLKLRVRPKFVVFPSQIPLGTQKFPFSAKVLRATHFINYSGKQSLVPFLRKLVKNFTRVGDVALA